MIIKRLSYNYIAKVQARSLKNGNVVFEVFWFCYNYTSRCVKCAKFY
jgi:hypothetical protein